MSWDTDLINSMDIESPGWAQTLFCSTRFHSRTATTSKLEILEEAWNKTKFLIRSGIASKVEKFHIRHSVIINLDQTPTK